MRASRIGDFLCATPALRSVRAALPDAEISLIALPFVRELVERSPHLDRFIEFPGFPGMAEQWFEPRKALNFFGAMQSLQFDLAIQLHGSGAYANPFTLMLGARVTAGFIREPGWPVRLDAALVFPEAGHEVRRMLALPLFLGAPFAGEQLDFPLWEQDRATAQDLLAQTNPPLIGIHPGARDPAKCWPSENFAAVARNLRDRIGGTVVLLGGEDAMVPAAELAGALGEHVLGLVGRTTLPQAGALIDRLAVLLTNDSGPAHIAYAVGTPSVTLFADTDPARWGPLDSQRHRVVHVFPETSADDATIAQVEQAALDVMRDKPFLI